MKNVLLTIFVLLGLSGLAQGQSEIDEKSRFEKLELFNKVLYLVENQYYRVVDTEKLIQGAIKGMLSTLDPHSSFLDQEVFSKMQEDTSGEFGGLGLEVTQKDGVLVVITPIDDTPAYKAGLLSGDKIVEINHQSTMGVTLEEAVKMMRGKPNSNINVGIVREGVEGVRNFDMKREIIKIRAVKSYVVKDDYILIRLSQFQKDVAENIESAIVKLRKEIKRKEGPKGIILDLRSNPGGLLDEAVNVSSLFLADGVVVSTEGRNPKEKEIRYVKKTGRKELKLPLIVLINGSSASASEIVAGALQDTKRAVIMGTRSFGKGSVQNVSRIDNDKGLKLTIAQYMTPNDRKIQALGITPDIEVPDSAGKWLEENSKDDNYLREADLRNHLTATIETKEETLYREKTESENRKNRIARIQERQKRKESEEDKYKKYEPMEDFLVLQAVNYINSIESLKLMIK